MFAQNLCILGWIQDFEKKSAQLSNCHPHSGHLSAKPTVSPAKGFKEILKISVSKVISCILS